MPEFSLPHQILSTTATPIEVLASVLFALAVLHTFSVKRFAHWAHPHPKGFAAKWQRDTVFMLTHFG